MLPREQPPIVHGYRQQDEQQIFKYLRMMPGTSDSDNVSIGQSPSRLCYSPLMLTRSITAVILAAISFPALAAGPGYRAEGTYERRGAYKQSAKVIAIDVPDSFAGSFSTGIAGCGGSVGMTGRAVGPRELIFTKRDETGGVCNITMRFSPDFRKAALSEDGCMMWHGASCDFEGQLSRTAN